MKLTVAPSPWCREGVVPSRDNHETKRPAQEKKGKAPIGPLMIGFFLFVVVGSSVLQIVQMAGMGGRIAQQMENQQPRAEPQPRPRKKKPTPAADP